MGRQAGQVTGDAAGRLLQGEHGFQFVLVLVAGPVLGGELEPDAGVVLPHGADDAGFRELLAGPGEGVTRGQFAGHRLVEVGGTQGGDQVQMPNGDAGARPGDHFAQELGAGDRRPVAVG